MYVCVAVYLCVYFCHYRSHGETGVGPPILTGTGRWICAKPLIFFGGVHDGAFCLLLVGDLLMSNIALSV